MAAIVGVANATMRLLRLELQVRNGGRLVLAGSSNLEPLCYEFAALLTLLNARYRRSALHITQQALSVEDLSETSSTY